MEVRAGGKNRETVTASLCLVFKGRGRIFGVSANQISLKSPPFRTNLSNQGNRISITCFQVNMAHENDSMPFYQVESNEFRTDKLFSDSKIKRH